MIELSLVAPGLLGPWPQHNRPGFPVPAARNLGRILATAQRHSAGGDFHHVIAALHGIDPEATREPPIACLSRLADGGHSDKKRWLRLDLVHLEVIHGNPRLGDTRALEITEAEGEQLWDVLKPYFEEIGWRVEPLHRTRWYLSLDSDVGLYTRSVGLAVAKSMEGAHPPTPDVGQWLARLTEIQMLLHATSVNRERERRGQPTINALWPRGGDVLPDKVQAAATMVFSADVVLAGLAVMSEEQYSNELPRDFASLIGATSRDTSVLVAFDEPDHALAADDPSRWSLAIEELDRLWLAPALAAIRSGKLRRLQLWTCDGWTHQVSFPRAWLACLYPSHTGIRFSAFVHWRGGQGGNVPL